MGTPEVTQMDELDARGLHVLFINSIVRHQSPYSLFGRRSLSLIFGAVVSSLGLFRFAPVAAHV